MPKMNNRPALPPPSGRSPGVGAVALLSLSFAGLIAVGCTREEQVTRYFVPKDSKPPERLLGAIVPHNDRTWFVKLLGPQPAVDKHEKEFTQFIESVRFPDKGDRPITWDVPKGWEEKPGADLRYATFILEPQPSPLELSVTPLGAEAGSLLSNVNRWREQMGLATTTEAELAKLTRTIKVGGKEVTLVDMKADGSDEVAVPPAASAGRPTFKPPEGWKRSSRQVPFSIATFEVRDGDQTADITVSPLKGPAGGLAGNIHRWRQQVGLPSVSEEELKKDLRPIEVDGVAGEFVDLSSTALAAKKERILGAVVPGDGVTWFIKMRGPAELVEKQKTAFEAFLKSVRLKGDRGAKP